MRETTVIFPLELVAHRLFYVGAMAFCIEWLPVFAVGNFADGRSLSLNSQHVAGMFCDARVSA